MCDFYQLLLHRELMWNKWKNDGCPSFALKEPEKKKEGEERNGGEVGAAGDLNKNRKRKARLGDMVGQAPPYILK